MSGQPTRTQADANKFRNEYMETLDLQDEINDYNLQANKTYLLTGALPPQSQMQDTRTNAEKLRDIEGMKQNVAEQLRPIAEPQFAYAIVDKVMNSPLNIDNSLFRFLAQRADSIAEQLKKIMPYGIAGDENDLLRIVEYIKNMYSETQGKFQTTKSYMNSISSSSNNSRVISANDIDSVILGLDDIIKNVHILSSKTSRETKLMDKIGNIYEVINNLKSVLPTTNQLKLYLDELNDVENIDQQPYNLNSFFGIIEKLPKYTEVMALINKIKQYINNGNMNLFIDGLNRLEKMFSSVEDIKNQKILQEFRIIKERQATKETIMQNKEDIQTRAFIKNQNEEQKDISKAQKVYIVNPEDDAVWIRGGMPIQQSQSNVSSYTPPEINSSSNISRPPKPSMRQGIPGAMQEARKEVITKAVNKLTNEQLQDFLSILNKPNVNDKKSVIDELINDTSYGKGDYNTSYGLGVGKRRGRPRGGGIKPIVEVQKQPTFIGFGINEINQKQLNNGIVKIRRNTKSNYMDMPSKRVSSNLQGIIKTIVGGGVPKFNELNSLDEDEKEYLHKIISRSNLEDKLSVPAPSKDQQEKDIHNFEVMRGQLMSGNDSQELVKKFKLLIRKLSKQGLLPKSDVEDLLETLADLNY